MAANKRNATQIANNRREIVRLYLRERLTQAEIGARLGMSREMVSYDLRAMQREWLKAGFMDLTAHKARELAKIDELELTYWAAWERSTGAREISTTGKTATGAAHAQIRKETREGNPAFLAGVQWCIERRCKLLGMDAPTRVEQMGRTEIWMTWGDEVADAERAASASTVLAPGAATGCTE